MFPLLFQLFWSPGRCSPTSSVSQDQENVTKPIRVLRAPGFIQIVTRNTNTKKMEWRHRECVTAYRLRALPLQE